MRTSRKLALLSISFVLFGASAAVAQPSSPQKQSDEPPASSSGTQGTAPENGSVDQGAPSGETPSAGPACRQQAEISQKAMRTRQSIMNNMKTQVQNVKDDTTLTPQQQRRQIRQIRQNARQQIGRVVTPEQEKALRTCQQQRKANAARPDSPPPTPPANEPN